MAEFTPGPWYYTTHDDGSFEVYPDVEGRGPMIAMRCLWTRNAKASQANSRLIAAAPDLLAACLSVLEHPGACLIPHWIHGLLAEAVAKAEGKADGQ